MNEKSLVGCHFTRDTKPEWALNLDLSVIAFSLLKSYNRMRLSEEPARTRESFASIDKRTFSVLIDRTVFPDLMSDERMELSQEQL